MFLNHRRFFIDFKLADNTPIIIKDKELNHQIRDVLRLRVGDQIILLDGSGFEFLMTIDKINPKIEGYISKKNKNQNEPEKKIILIQALLKSDRFEQVLKFCTNIGVAEFLPIITSRCVVKEISQSKERRYQKIIQESAEQAQRAILPKLNKVISFKELLSNLNNKTLKLIAWEKEQETEIRDLKAEIGKAEEIYVFIGPEGGLTEEEVSLLKENGFLTFSLGKLVLRAEIAGLIAGALIIKN